MPWLSSLSHSFLFVPNMQCALATTAKHWADASGELATTAPKLHFLSSSSSFRIHHYACIVIDIFPHVNSFAFNDIEFHLSFCHLISWASSVTFCIQFCTHWIIPYPLQTFTSLVMPLFQTNSEHVEQYKIQPWSSEVSPGGCDLSIYSYP